MNKPDVSIIIPAYKEAGIIGQTLEQTAAFLENHPELGRVEVIVVAAKAKDQTARLAREKASLFTDLKVIEPGPKVGKGRDVRAGMLAATGKRQLFMDADLATPLHHIPKALKKLETHDIVIGKRQLSKVHDTFIRWFLSVCGNLLIQLLVLPGVRDSQCGFKGFRSAAAKSLFKNQSIMGWGFDIELLAMAKRQGHSIAEIEIPDWKDPRVEDLRDESSIQVAFYTLFELLRIRLKLWRESLANPHAELGILAALFAVTTVLFSAQLGQGSLWFDEAFTTQIIQYSYPDIIRLTAADVHPPLYYFVLKEWASLFGNTEVALRSLSVIFTLGAALVSYLLSRRLFGTRVALIAIIPVILAAFLIRYAGEARMYAMAAFICIMATYALVRAGDKKHSGRWWIAYSLLVIAGLYTHYFTALVWIAHWVWKLLAQNWKGIFEKKWLAANGLAIAAFMPWLPTAQAQITSVRDDGFWIKPLNFEQIGNVATSLFIYVPGVLIKSWQIWLVALAVAATIFLGAYAFRRIKGKERAGLLLLVLYAVVPLIVLVIVSLPPRQSVFAERYFAHTSIGLYLLVGVSLAYFLLGKSKVIYKIVLASLMIGTLAYGAYNVFATGNMNFSNLRQPQARTIASYLDQQAKPDDGILSESYIYYELAYYRPLNFYDAKREVVPKGGQAMLYNSPQQIHNLTEFGKKHEYVWYVTLYNTSTNIPENWHVTHEHWFGDYKVTQYKTRS